MTGGPRYYGLLRRTADNVAGPWPRERAVGGLLAVLGAVKSHRRNTGAREATGGPWECGLLRRAADVVAGPRPRERAVGGLCGLGAREATFGPRYYRLLLAPRTSSWVRGNKRGASAACRPF